MKTLRIDPGNFIFPPFIKCPKCGKESFGILTICDEFYLRRCKKCLFPADSETSVCYPLPKLDKKIIYIDQFAISNMMKVLNPDTKAFQKGKLDEFWLKLFEKLDFLCKSQLIICPESVVHTYESLLSSYFEQLKQMYQLLSCGVVFKNINEIKEIQVYEHVRNWIGGEKDKEINIDIHSVTNGMVNAWQEKLNLRLNRNYDLAWIDELRKNRGKIHEGFREVFKRWQSEKNKTFNDWFEEETKEFGRIVISNYMRYYQEKERVLKRIFEGNIESNDLNFFSSPPSVKIIRVIQNTFKRAGVENSVIWPKTIEYLNSPSIKKVPFIKISSMFYAALARKAATGQKKPPNQGMWNDIEIISVLLPYCDAMFIDNECHSYLKENPLRDEINYDTKIFSQSCKSDFLQYLNEIESNQTKEHLDKLNEVYGNSWKRPYTDIYK